MEALQKQLEGNSDREVVDRYNQCYERFLQLDGYELENDAERCMRQVELTPTVWSNSLNKLSGGQKTRAQLARILLQKPACVVMDEPTNHLDQETIEWLETWLQQYTGAVLFVSHDRYFLDRTAHSIYELNRDGGKRYLGGYSDYRRQKEVEKRTQETLYKKQEQKRKELLETIRRYQQWFQQAHKSAGQNDFARAQAKKNVSRFKAKEKELERLEGEQVQKPGENKRMKMRLDSQEFSAKALLRLEAIHFSYAKRPIFEQLNLSIKRGDRMAVTGRNGSGKTTLLKLLIGELRPTAGEIKMNPQTKIGYFAQELERLEQGQTILDSFLSIPGMTQTEARTLLGSFLFSRDDVFKTIGTLSMGEKCRIAFLKLYFSDANLLVLDEPTNFLDIQTREVMEEVLQSYSGAMVLVSHDRYLLEKNSEQSRSFGRRYNP